MQLLEALQAQLLGALDGVGKLTSTANPNARDFGQSLQTYGDRLAPNLDIDALRGIVGALGAETHRMQQSNELLTEELAASQREFMDLKEQLETVQNEALLDPLTGLQNRRGFQRFVDQLVAGASGGLAGAWLLMADIDHFKKVNDTHGHIFGDKVLQAVAQVLREGVKGRHLPIRFGGEEFAIVMPNTSESSALALAEHIRQSIARCRILRAGRSEAVGSVTISLGVTAYRPGETLENWISRADQALYQSKGRGRNCVTLANTQPASA